MTTVLAIDPGVKGAAAFVTVNGPKKYHVKVFDLSDAAALETEIRENQGRIQAAWIEEPLGWHARNPKTGRPIPANVAGMITLGKCAGYWLGFVRAHCPKAEYVNARIWQRPYLHLARRGKGQAKAAVRRYIETVLHCADLCTGPLGGWLDGRADAIAMGVALAEQRQRIG